MKTLYLRIYLTLVGVLLAFLLGAGWLAQRQVAKEQEKNEAIQDERLEAVAGLLAQSLPPATAPVSEQADALMRWSQQLRMPLALQGPDGQRLASNQRFERREERGDAVMTHRLPDGRQLLLMRPWRANRPEAAGVTPAGIVRPAVAQFGGSVLIGLFVLLFVGVALGAYPVVRRLTRRLEALQRGVERFGAGDLTHRVALEGRDEVAALAGSFNQTADRVQQLLQANQSLLANASHELRSPLARLKMALQLRASAESGQHAQLDAEVQRNLSELDALVDEVLLSSRLQAQARPLQLAATDVLGLLAEEAAALDIELEELPPQTPTVVQADERLLRRAVRNLLENARRYGGHEQRAALAAHGTQLQVRVLDRGPGVPPELTQRIFEPFFRLPGHAEMAGGVGLGLSLVRQIAQAHGGDAFCEPRPGGGSVFVIALGRP